MRTIQLPANGFAIVFHHDSQIAIEAALYDSVIAAGEIAIQPQAGQMYHECVSGHCAFNVKKSCFGIASSDAPNALFVSASGIDGCSVDRIPRRYLEDRLVPGRKLPIENRWYKFVTFCGSSLQRWKKSGGEVKRRGLLGLVLRIFEGYSSRQSAILYITIDVGGTPLFVRCKEMGALAFNSAFQGNSIPRSSEL